MTRGWHGAAVVTAVEAMSLLVGFFTQPLLMRTLGPADYGSYVLAVAVGVFVFTLTDFGFNVSGVQRAIALRGDAGAEHRHFWSVLLAKGVIGVLSVAAVGLGTLLAPSAPAHLLLPAAAVSALAAVLFPTWFLLASNRLLQMAGALLLARICSFALIVLLVRGAGQQGLAMLLTLAVPLLATAFVALDPDLRARWRWCAAPRSEVGLVLRAGATTAWIATFPSLAGAAVQSLIVALASGTTLGLYASADKIRAALQGLFTAFGNAVFPSSVERLGSGDRSGRDPVLALLGFNMALALLVAAPVAVWPREIIVFVSGPRFADAAVVLRILGLAIVTSTFVATVGLQLLVPLQQNAAYARAMMAGLVVHCTALALLVPGHGARGAAVSLVLADLCSAALLVPRLVRYRRERRARASSGRT